MKKYEISYNDVIQAHLANGQIDDLYLSPLFQQMCTAIQHLHSKHIVHRDVKADNFLLDRFDLFDPECRVVLCDMGTAVDCFNRSLDDQVGTRFYWAPEIHSPTKYSFPVDVWALGIILYGSIYGKFPFANRHSRPKWILSFGEDIELTKPCMEFLTALLAKDFQKRPVMDEVLKLAWLQDEQVENSKIVSGSMEITGPRAIVSNTDILIEDTPSFTSVADGVTRHWEWWDPERLGCQPNPFLPFGFRISIDPACVHELSLAWSPSVINSLFEGYGIDLSKFGGADADTIESIANEVQMGECTFLQVGGKELFRLVVAVLIKVIASLDSGLCYLIETKLKFADGRARVTNRLPGIKKRRNEGVYEAARRCIVDYLGLKPEHIDILSGDESFEEKRDSLAYPGLTTFYVKRFVCVHLRATKPEIRKQLHMDEGLVEFDLSSSSKSDVRSWQWWPAAKC